MIQKEPAQYVLPLPCLSQREPQYKCNTDSDHLRFKSRGCGGHIRHLVGCGEGGVFREEFHDVLEVLLCGGLEH
jgi:hypothetical protein